MTKSMPQQAPQLNATPRLHLEARGIARQRRFAIFAWAGFAVAWIIAWIYYMGVYLDYVPEITTGVGVAMLFLVIAPPLLCLIGLGTALARPSRIWLDEVGLWRTIHGASRCQSWKREWRVSLEILIDLSAEGVRSQKLYAPRIVLEHEKDGTEYLYPRMFGMDLQNLACVVDGLLGESSMRDESFVRRARLHAVTLPLPLRSLDQTASKAKALRSAYIYVAIMSFVLITISNGVGSNLIWAVGAFGCILATYFEIRDIKASPHQVVIKDSGIAMVQNGVEVEFTPWTDCVACNIPRARWPFRKSRPIKLRDLDSVELHVRNGGRVRVPLREFDELTSDTLVTLDALLPETCIRDQSFLDCLARTDSTT